MGQAFLKQNVKVIGGLPYELVGEIDVASAVTRVDFTGLNFTSGDDLLLVSDVKTAGLNIVRACANGNTTLTNYNRQQLLANDTLVTGERAADNWFMLIAAEDGAICYSKIKITNSGYFVSQNKTIYDVGGTLPRIYERFITSSFTILSLTTLNIISSKLMSIGSNFKLYKLIAEKVADVEVTGSAVTQVDFTGLSIGKDSEYMLVSDHVLNGAISKLGLFVNDNVTEANYYNQNLKADATTVSGSRTNTSKISETTTGEKSLSISNLKVTNIGYITVQSDAVRDYGGSIVKLENNYLTSTFTVTNITKLSIISSIANGIGVGSKFTLYKIK